MSVSPWKGAGGFVLAAALVGAPACRGRAGGAERSVILVTLDTTRADRIGAYGGRAVPTPNLDAIARDGVVFEEAISQVPLTLPSHASILTGRYPASNGVRHNGLYRLPTSIVTLATDLKAAGFETAAFVGAYVLNRGFGLEQGFDVYDDIGVNRFQGGQDRLFEAQRPAEEVNAAVFRWLERRRPGRFFLWVHYYDPHFPYRPPERPGRSLAGTGYDREIFYVDSCFGDLVARLRSAGVLDDALLVVAGDHGESLGEHGEDTHGFFLYESALRVPLLARSPGLLKPGTRVRGPVELVDIVPTVLDFLGLPPLKGVEGKSLRPRIEGSDDGSTSVAYAETLLPRLEYGLSSLAMVRGDRYKYIRAPRPELYDLRADPGEEQNRAASDRARAGEMATLVGSWMSRAPAGTPADARKILSREEEERLRSLGYLASGADRSGLVSDEGLEDPKDGIAEVRKVKESRERFHARDWNGAIAIADGILRGNPKNHEALMTRILSLIEMKRYPEAEKDALAALASAEKDAAGGAAFAARARAVLASVYRLSGKSREAEEAYRRVLADDPGNDVAAVDFAGLLADSGRGAEALRIVDGILRKDPRNGLALAARFEFEAAAGDRSAALASARGLADSRAGDAGTLVEAGLALLEAGDPSRAATCFETALAQQPQPDPELLGQLGAAQIAAGRLGEARDAFLAMSRVAPADPRPYLYLGQIALKGGDEAGGRAALGRALALDPRDITPLVVLARYLSARGSRDDAARVLEDALRRNPGDPQARALLDAVRARGAAAGR